MCIHYGTHINGLKVKKDEIELKAMPANSVHFIGKKEGQIKKLSQKL